MIYRRFQNHVGARGDPHTLHFYTGFVEAGLPSSGDRFVLKIFLGKKTTTRTSSFSLLTFPQVRQTAAQHTQHTAHTVPSCLFFSVCLSDCLSLSVHCLMMCCAGTRGEMHKLSRGNRMTRHPIGDVPIQSATCQSNTFPGHMTSQKSPHTRKKQTLSRRSFLGFRLSRDRFLLAW